MELTENVIFVTIILAPFSVHEFITNQYLSSFCYRSTNILSALCCLATLTYVFAISQSASTAELREKWMKNLHVAMCLRRRRSSVMFTASWYDSFMFILFIFCNIGSVNVYLC